MTLLLAIAVCCLATAAEESSTRSRARVSWDLGARYFSGARAEVHIEERTTLVIRHPGGRKQTARSVREAELSEQAVATPEGPLQVTLRLGRLALKDEDPLHPVAFDLKADDPKVAPAATAPVDARLVRARNLIGKTAQALASSDGLGAPTGEAWVSRILASLGGDRPGHAVRIGDEWTVQSEITVAGLGRLSVSRRYRFAGIEESGVRQLAKLSIKVSMEPVASATEEPLYELISCSGSGSRRLDLVSGRLTEETLQVDLQLATETTTLESRTVTTTTVRTLR